MTSAYLLWKTAHILSATILFGTGLGIAFFCWFGYRDALRRGEIAALRSVLRLTVIADACFTAPAVVFQAISGLVLMHLLGWPLASPWALASIALFALVGACWLPVLVIQVRLLREAQRAASIAALGAGFHRWFRIWFMLGVPAFAAVVAIYYLMVAKPLSPTTI
ncbi:MAG: DUF2269 domain-containing protein [Betaproteobacteria bacterium]|nr:DUF2269 domain-containing protein [Betaproteobacteria bacterium]